MRNKLGKLFGHRKVSGIDCTLALIQVHRPVSGKKVFPGPGTVIYGLVLFPSQLTHKISGSRAPNHAYAMWALPCIGQPIPWPSQSQSPSQTNWHCSGLTPGVWVHIVPLACSAF